MKLLLLLLMYTQPQLSLMAPIGLFEVLFFFCFLILYYFLIKKPLGFKKDFHSNPRNWPVLGMLPGALVILHLLYDWSVDVLENANLTFQFIGPWLSGMDILITVDPENINYILSSNFSNYIKGPEYQEVFEAYGDGIVNSDLELWRNLRKASQVIFGDQGFQNFTTSTTRSKLKDGLVPLFNHFAKEEMVVDLQDVFQRFMFDTTFISLTGFDMKSLSLEMPEVGFANALDDVGDAIMYRHITPRFLWKLQKWIGVGREKKMTEANATFDRVCATYVSAKRDEIKKGKSGEDLLTLFMKLDTTKFELLNPSDDKFLKDFTVGFMAAGRDSTASGLTWFFWNMSENPRVLTKILQEIKTNLPTTTGSDQDTSYLNKLVYLHCALSESLRLFPPIPFERKSPIKPDVLPSGHKVKSATNIMFFIYAMGRMKTVWGEDAMEFKPERWISETGGFKHQPSYKFLSFNAGPRTCLGKNLAINLMKAVIVEILQNYEIKFINGQKIEPKPGLVLYMKHGLKVTITKKCSSPE
ncbi:alkane hydroxylase MAH1-like [Brassica napus]|uniref:alkane hydroxylase MAH1-like n=1 Tax=Brassica napus TaxID=3708 RepID=UPI002079033D|nr:alkane hydroxylase MAH1-like [Brassica napus]